MKKIIIITLVLLFILSINSHASDSEMPRQDETLSIVYNGDIYCNVLTINDTYIWINFGNTIEYYGLDLNEGVYMTKWDNDIYRGGCNIEAIASIYSGGFMDVVNTLGLENMFNIGTMDDLY